MTLGDFQPRWRHRKLCFASSYNQKKDNKFKNKNQPEQTENETVWNSDNQGVKEETFILAGRRGRHGQPEWRGHMASRRLEDWVGKPVAGDPFVCV